MVRNKSGGEMGKYLHHDVIPNEDYVFNRIGLEGKNIREEYLSKQNEEKPSKSTYKPSRKKLAKNFIKRFLFKLLKKLKLQQPVASSEVLSIGSFRLSGEIHQWMYDRYSLAELLKKVGFTDIKICNAFESRITDWKKYNLDVINEEVRKPDSLFIEAKKV